LTARPPPPYHGPPEQAQPDVSNTCRVTKSIALYAICSNVFNWIMPDVERHTGTPQGMQSKGQTMSTKTMKNAMALGTAPILGVAGAVVIATASPSWAMSVPANTAAVSTAASNQVTDVHYYRRGYHRQCCYRRGYYGRAYAYPYWYNPYSYYYPYYYPYFYPYYYTYPFYGFGGWLGWGW
jgi:hypothetical protein